MENSSFRGKFIKNDTYYTGEVYEWNLPTGTTCPHARDCKITVNRETGRFRTRRGYFHCYAAFSERFPAVREHRWRNYEYVLAGGIPGLPKDCRHVRIHSSGDFYSQEYFDMWLEVARVNPAINFWAFTKSLNFWLARRNSIPTNLILTASYGGRVRFSYRGTRVEVRYGLRLAYGHTIRPTNRHKRRLCQNPGCLVCPVGQRKSAGDPPDYAENYCLHFTSRCKTTYFGHFPPRRLKNLVATINTLGRVYTHKSGNTAIFHFGRFPY